MTIVPIGVVRGGRAEPVDDAAEVIWATAGSELFVLLTGERHWSHDRYEAWLHDTWCRLLLPT
ncbi:MAG: hypothetical protein R2698_14625 [Microthrixaceae bacterium]